MDEVQTEEVYLQEKTRPKAGRIQSGGREEEMKCLSSGQGISSKG